jgi:hypothetical protein
VQEKLVAATSAGASFGMLTVVAFPPNLFEVRVVDSDTVAGTASPSIAVVVRACLEPMVVAGAICAGHMGVVVERGDVIVWVMVDGGGAFDVVAAERRVTSVGVTAVLHLPLALDVMAPADLCGRGDSRARPQFNISAALEL